MLDVPNEHALRFQDVSFTIDRKPIIQGITGVFPKRKITALVGPSGAGKTTLLKLCNNLLTPTSGVIYMKGKPLNELDPRNVRKQVGIVLQNSPIIQGSVYENLSLPARLHGETLSKKTAKNLLLQVGLDAEILQQDAQSLSGGQRQKLSIARTLVNQSTILLLDEITSSLDRNSARDIEELIFRLNRTGRISVVWITHNLEQAIRIADHVWVMMDGKLVAEGASDLLTSPANYRVKLSLPQ